MSAPDSMLRVRELGFRPIGGDPSRVGELAGSSGSGRRPKHRPDTGGEAMMPNEPDISELIARAKAGDDAAIREFLTRFEPEVRIMVRGRLPKLLRTRFDSMDFVQAVWQSFFADLRSSSQRFENVHHLRGFLAGVARNKVYEEHRRLTRTKKHALGREQSLYVRRGSREVELALISPEPTPSQVAQASERLAQLV